MFAEMARLAGVPFERIKAATLFLKSGVGRAGRAVGRAAVSAGQATGRVAVGAGKMAFDNLVYVTDQIMNAVAGEPPSKRDARLIAILNAAADPSGLSEVDLARLKVIRKRPGYKWSDYFEDDDDVVDIKPIPFSKRAIFSPPGIRALSPNSSPGGRQSAGRLFLLAESRCDRGF